MYHEGLQVDDPFAGVCNIEPRVIRMRGHRWDLWQQVRFPVAARRADVRHSPANTAPRFPLGPLVVTIHDLIPLMAEAALPAAAAWAKNVRRAAATAKRIITPSEYSKACLVHQLAVPPEKIVVNPWAPDGKCRKVTDPAALARVRSRYALAPGQPYVLGYGASDPRKNTPRILEAWAGTSARIREQYALLLVGVQGPALANLRAQAVALGLPEKCVEGFADEADLYALLSGATALVYPSLAEGFGLPVLDAFLCEVAVLTSSTTSLPEVAGDAALLVDPTDTRALRDGLERILSSPELRGELVARGLRRVKDYTWERCADGAARVLETAAGL